ncbi:lytic transglycosylase domain-containing protein [Alkalibacillus silvisoli]|uniref:Transglycosylase SLT domain-containing protein n=1 Tax=Alkalibacillus silvisoli TaxID=392823 RepID=A0ABP3JXY2_9BACI
MFDSRMFEVLMNYQRSVSESPLLNKQRQQSGTQEVSFQNLFMNQLGINQQSTTPSNSLMLDQSQLGPVANTQMNPINFNSTVSKSDYDEIIDTVAEKYNLDADLIREVIQTESNFNPQAVSHAGAQGLMQLMPATAESLGVRNAFDPEENIEGGARYLSDMLNRYDGDLEKALAAYNAGPGNVDYYGGVPPFEETQNYVRRILG